jgi:hyperosmotically inducible protein
MRLEALKDAAFGLAVAGLLAFAVPAAALDDAALQQKIEARLRKAGLANDVSVAVEGGRATLTGAAGSLEARREALEAALKEATSVDDRMQLTVAPRADEAILRDVERAILGYPYYGVFDSVAVGVKDGAVVLQGSVRQPYRKDDIEERVVKVAGLRAIDNQIRVQPLSFNDDRLRAELLHGIYGSALFDRFAYWADPPVRIVVENGHVTLTGYVASQVEKQVAGMLARGTLAFSVDNQLKLDDEKPREAAGATSGE